MGAEQSAPLKREPTFLVERILAAECDFLPETSSQAIIVGAVGSSQTTNNPLAKQGISIGNEPIRCLLSVSETNGSLSYTFENSTELRVFKRENGEVCYNLKTPSLNETRSISEPVRRRYKNIGLGDATLELDKLVDLLR